MNVITSVAIVGNGTAAAGAEPEIAGQDSGCRQGRGSGRIDVVTGRQRRGATSNQASRVLRGASSRSAIPACSDSACSPGYLVAHAPIRTWVCGPVGSSNGITGISTSWNPSTLQAMLGIRVSASNRTAVEAIAASIFSPVILPERSTRRTAASPGRVSSRRCQTCVLGCPSAWARKTRGRSSLGLACQPPRLRRR